MKISVHQLTVLEEFRIWLEDADTALKADLVTYYGICSVVGLVQGSWIGNTISCYMAAMGY
jgi:hypothetical protein